MDETLAKLESNRKIVMKYYLYNGLLLFLSVIAYYAFKKSILIIPIILFVVTLAMFLFFTMQKRNAYVSSFKHDVVEAILKGIFDELYFDPKSGIPESTIKATGMMQLGNRYSSDDYIKGKYKGTDFEQSDVCIQQETSDSEGHSSTTTYFKGRWMIFGFNKDFAADLQVRESGFHYAKKKGGWFAPKEEKMNKLELEDAEFNKDFDVFAQNEQEAYYILTPHIMQSIKTLRDRTNGKLILCFSASKLHVGVNNNENAFEPPIFKKLDVNVINSIYDEINVITRFVDELKLDRNLYKQNI
jgi:hypothetical protein